MALSAVRSRTSTDSEVVAAGVRVARPIAGVRLLVNETARLTP